MTVAERYMPQIRENLPVVFAGLELYPLTVRDYGLYLAGKKAFELMLSSLQDPRLARLPWCACLDALDRKCEKETGERGFFLDSVLLVLTKALRLGAIANQRTGVPEYPIRTLSQEGMLIAIVVGNTEPIVLTMQQMDEVRQIIAAQNGYELPDESWNPELVRAAQENARNADNSIDYDTETLIYSVAYQCHCKKEEVYDWTIKDFMSIQEAIDRSFGYMIFNLAQTAGWVEFKHGNPYPTWKFNKKANMPAGFRTISDIDAGAKGLIAGT